MDGNGVESYGKTSAGATGLRCERLAVRLGGRTILKDFSAAFAPGELTVLVGPNGAGKTTLLRAMARAIPLAAGRTLLDGADASALPRIAFARRVAFLPQAPDAAALGGLTVQETVACGRIPHAGFFGSHGRADDEAVRDALRDAGLDGFADRDAASLSGGETRRVFLAACLAQRADVLLLDEPFEGLDAASRRRLAALLRNLLSEGRTIVVATHDLTPLRGIPFRELPVVRAAGQDAPAPAAVRRLRALPLALLGALSVALLAAHILSGPRELLLPYRLPRALCAFTAGGVLAVAGCLYQTLFRNPMASPYTLGTASGATLGAFLATVLAGPAVSVGAASFAGALLSLAVVRACGGNGKASRLLLGGIACAYLFTAGTMLCQFAMTPWESFSMAHWSLGEVAVPSRGWGRALALAWGAALALTELSRVLDAFLAGDDAASSHGLHAARLRLALLLAASLLTACAVAVCGPIGFVGLLVPHLGRLLVGAAHRRLLPFCAVGGGLFLALCDALARSLPTPGTLPVGVVTSAIGAPVLVALLARRERR